MSNVYEGNPDGRQSGDTQESVSRFRPRYRALTDKEKALHDEIETKAAELEKLYEQLKPPRYAALAMRGLEESVMWAVKGLTA